MRNQADHSLTTVSNFCWLLQAHGLLVRGGEGSARHTWKPLIYFYMGLRETQVHQSTGFYFSGHCPFSFLVSLEMLLIKGHVTGLCYKYYSYIYREF